MSINRREFLSLPYSCAAAFSVWIPKSLKPQQTAGKLSRAELKQKDYWPPDSLSCKDIGTPEESSANDSVY